MKKYTVGFVFDECMNNVLLIHKTHPPFQKDTYNGLGGEIEGVETPEEAMARECEEESNLLIQPHHWHRFGQINKPKKVIYFLSAIFTGNPAHAKTMTEESVRWISTQKIPAKILPTTTEMLEYCIAISSIDTKREGEYKILNLDE